MKFSHWKTRSFILKGSFLGIHTKTIASDQAFSDTLSSMIKIREGHPALELGFVYNLSVPLEDNIKDCDLTKC